MIKNHLNLKMYFKTLIVICLLFVSLSDMFAQSWQSDIIQKLKLHQNINHQEKIFVQTDRPIYLPGETIWFNAFVLNASTQTLNMNEVVLHVELLKPDKTINSKEMFKIENGLVSGQFELKHTTKPGTYYLIAYTNWMRNAGSRFYFSKQIVVSGTNEATESVEPSTKVDIDNEPNELTEVEEQKIKRIISFYPEGGDLLTGVPSKVAFEVIDGLGIPQSFMGMVEDNTGQIVAAAKTLWRGKGFFMLTPQEGKEYYIKEVGLPNEAEKYKLPDAQTSGLAMSVSDRGKDKPVQISISQKGNIASDSLVFLLAVQNGQPKNALNIDLRGRDNIVVEMDKKDFKNGIVQFTLFDGNKMARAERLLFIKKGDALNIKVNEKSLPNDSRGQITLGVEVTDHFGDPVEGVFSVAATDASRVPDRAYRSPDLTEYMSLYSDLPLLKWNEPVLFDDSGEGNFKSDLLMLTNGWRRYQWEEVLSDSLALPNYFEEPGIYVKGKVRSVWGKDKVPQGANVTMVAGSVFNSYSEQVDENGEFTFIMNDFYGSKKVVFQTKSKKDNKKDYKLDVQSMYQPKSVDRFDYLSMAYLPSEEDQEVDIKNIQLSKDVLQKELARVVVEDTFVVTTDVSIEEVAVKADTKKSAKEEMNEKYGTADYSVGEMQIEEQMEDQPWYDGVFALLYDAFPELRISTITDEMNVSKISQSGDVDSSGSTSAIYFQLIGKRRHRFYVYVDGKMVGASNIKGQMRGVFGTYTIDDLITLDPKEVKSMDLLFPDSPSDRAQLIDDARFYSNEQRDLSTLDGRMDDMITESDLQSTPPAILSIYTKAGGGLYSTVAYKGISNLTLRGFKRKKEYYHFDYSTALNDSVWADERNTLAWFPVLKTDQFGKAEFSFYASDVSNKIRLEMNGVSNDGKIGSRIYQTPDSLFMYEQYVEPERVIIPVGGSNEAFQTHLLLPDLTPAAFARISSVDKTWSTYTSTDGLFEVDQSQITPTSQLLIEKPGYKDIQCSYQELINNKKTLAKENLNLIEENGLDIIKKVYRSRFKNRNSKNIFFKGAFRQTIYDGINLHEIKDYNFIQKWPNMAEVTIPIQSKITGGGEFQSVDKRRKIRFDSKIKNGEVKWRDPLFDLQSFLDLNFQKEYAYVLVGETKFQGRKMYRIHFDQYDDIAYAFYQGELLIDAETYGVAWASWKYSEKASKYLMPDMFIVKYGSQQNFELLNEHREMTWKFNGEYWEPDFAVHQFSFTLNGEEKRIKQEINWVSISQEEYKGIESEIPKTWKKLLKTNVQYDPAQWRDSWILPPDLDILNQMKYLNEMISYE
ncbi:MG2 domain-containing protein [Carboxylicivirga linearis]|uniref:Macroglobulin domain-containing protein n=1 Tax=Carboxylicivirga linearis TaxID=1628157 RepID=A0ABS5K135_9BACT|nr:MG2 domain-containing protein [Carboxylicivirga linearis]MBS2100404.1 hypothetical protein [Carboxylicivirga linearis]